MNLCCPHCQNAFEIVADDSDTEVTCPKCESRVTLLEFLSFNAGDTQTRTTKREFFSPPLGTSVAHFRLDKKLGKGGFGTVYQAFDTRLERYVALKIPRLEKMSRWQAEVFIHEAQSAAQLQDPNIVSVFEVGRDDSRIFIVSELIEGITLDKWKKTKEPSQREIATIIAVISRSIHRAHDKGVIHRDLKPKNVIVDSDGKPHVTDFGLAKRENPEEITITTSGTIIGTPAYMSPEQAMGKANEADGRTDVYSLGVMLYELLTGRRPFRGETDILTEEILCGEATEPHTLNASVHPDIEAICLKAMARKPGNRFDSALSLAEDLERFAGNEPTLTRPLTGFQRAGRFAGQHWAKIGIAALILGSITFGLVAALNNPGLVPVAVQFDVEFEVFPADSEVSVVKVDYRKGRVDYESLHQPGAETTQPGLRSDKLSAGWYVIEVVSKTGDIQEVWRYLPRDLSERANADFACTAWKETESGRIRWRPITVKPFSATPRQASSLGGETVLEVAGDNFEAGAVNLFHMGEDPMPIRPLQRVLIYDFYVGEKEVSVANFKKVMGRLPYSMQHRFKKEPAPDELAVGNVAFVEALEYCERIGARLPIFEEYLFAATNGGETELPWGDDWKFLNWPAGLNGLKVDDENQLGIRNLYSNQLEWTQDYAVPLDSLTNSTDWGGDTNPLTAGLKHSRLAVGGPMSALDGEVKSVGEVQGPRHPYVMKLQNAHHFEGLGFRCYRSKTPRLKLVNPVIGYVTSANPGE